MDILIIFSAQYLILFVVLAAAVYFFKQDRKRQKEIVIFAIITLPIIYIAAKIIGVFYYDPRPFVSENIVPLIAHAPDNGFPSDHALLSSAIAFILIFYNRIVGWSMLLLALLIGFSRVLAGVHHSIDIIGAVLISLAVAYSVFKFLMPAIKKSSAYQKFLG